AAHHHLHSFPTRRSSDLRQKLHHRPQQRSSRSCPAWGILKNYHLLHWLCCCDCYRACWVCVPRCRWCAVPPSSSWQARPLRDVRSEEHTSELQSRFDLVC